MAQTSAAKNAAQNKSANGIDPRRQAALDTALAQVEKSFGKGSAMRLGDRPEQDVEVIPTGSLALDMALGIGGLPKGRIVEIYGPESSGKTTLALHVVANAQKAGGVAAFIDAEHALAGAGIAAAVAHGADAADALGDVAKLMHVALFGELLEPAVHKADLRNCLDDAVILDHQVQMKRLGQHRVLRAKRNNGAMCHGPYASFFCLSRAALAASAARTLAAFSGSMAASFASISAALSAALAAASSC